MPVTVTKDQLENYLRVFLKTYRSRIKKEYLAYFNEFPFYGALKAIGVMTHNNVYFIFTKDGNPKKTTYEVLDETDMPELMRVKDAFYSKKEDILILLGIKTHIWDMSTGDSTYELRAKGIGQWFNQANASDTALRSIKFHYQMSVDPERDLTKVTDLGRGKYKPPITSKYSFVYNTIDERSLRAKVKGIIDKAEEGEEVLITGWIGSFAIPLLKSLTKRNVKFRIITHKPTPPERGKSKSDQYDIFTTVLTKKYSDNMRILGKLHARLLISDKEALVSTADLTKDSHEGKFEAGISTTDGLTIKKLKDFFEEMWETAEPLKT